jgi:hypothetical protein
MRGAAEENRRERGRRLRYLGLFVALYAAMWLVLSQRASRVARAECTVVENSTYFDGYCSLAHDDTGVRVVSPSESCRRLPRIGSRVPCFYYVSEPRQVLLEPRRHAWPTPAPIVILAAALLLAALGQVLMVRARQAPGKAEARAADSPYRRPGEVAKDPPPPLAPLHVVTLSYGCGRWIFGGAFLLFGVVIVAMMLGIAWTTGGDLSPALFFFALGHGSLFLGVVGALLRSGIDVLPDEGLLVDWSAIGPLRWRRFVDLRDVSGASQRFEGAGRSCTSYLVVDLRRGMKPVRSDLGTSREQRERAKEIDERVRAYQARP